MDIKEEIYNFIFINTNVENVAYDTKLFEEGILNSLNMIELMIFIEKKFQVSINALELDINQFSDIYSIERYILGKL